MFRAEVRAVCCPQEALLTWFLYRCQLRGWVPAGPTSASGSRGSHCCSPGVAGKFSVHSRKECPGTAVDLSKSAYSCEFKLPE